MASPRSILHGAWNSCARGMLLSSGRQSVASTIPSRLVDFRRLSPTSTPLPPTTHISARHFSFIRNLAPHNRIQSSTTRFPLTSYQSIRLNASSTKPQAQDATAKPSTPREEPKQDEAANEEEEQSFQRTERADQASKLNLSARLGKEGAGGSKAGFSEVWRLIKIARPEVKGLALAIVLLMMSSGITMSIPFSIGKFMDIATNPEKAQDMLFGFDIKTFYIGLACVLTTGAAANYGRVLLLRIIGERTVTRLRSQLFRNTFIQNAEFFDANRVGDLISRLTSDSNIVAKSITQNLSDGLRALISGIAGFSLMAWVSPHLSGVLAIAFPPIAIGAFFYGRAVRNISRNIQKNFGTLTKIAEERLGSVRTSQAFAGEIQEVKRINTQLRKVFFLGRKEAFINATFFAATGWAGNMTILALLYVGGGLVQSGAISVGELTSFLMYAAYAGSSMFGLSSFYSELMKGVGAASRLFELQDRQPTISPTKGDPVTSLKGAIRFNDVSFAYPTRPAVSIFKQLNFTIEEGTNVAIVAPSGAGKSTVASLLMRFYLPDSGTITVKGKDISTMNAKQLRRKIGYVGQEPVLFSGSIAENISYGRPEATRSEIINAARRANCTFISDFPDGLETHVGARGTQLSGGQKQRIAIARALLKSPDILILDEATSALDAESETLVNQALSTLLRGHNTTISIAHRLSTIKRSDQIICIGGDGKVAEVGTYEQLTANKEGAFSRLMEWQMSGGSAEEQPKAETGMPRVNRENMDEAEQEALDEQVIAEQQHRG